MKELDTKLQEVDEDSEVKKILVIALEKYKKIHEQISRILNASELKQIEKFVDKDEALAAINGFLKILQKKTSELASIDDPDEKEIERARLITGLEQALETADKFKLKKELKILTEALENITMDSQENENES
jgi:vesicle coat complex subunit